MNTPEAKILAVDDDPQILDIINATLTARGYYVEAYESPKKALLTLCRKSFDLVLVDIVMPEIDGIQIVSHVKNSTSPQEIIVITGEPDQEKIDACKELGIHNFLIKPFNAQQLEFTVYAALYFQRVQNELKAQISPVGEGRLIGISKWMHQLREQIRIAAKSALPVLITGETGTGKELIANDIHSASNRSNKPFLAINCATLGTLADSELFGHVSGSFTGATRSTRGYIGSADGGTLFLDEVGDLPLELQAKLLRFLDSGEYLRVGEAKIRRADVRVISATNRDLISLCKEGKFREDLYYRLAGYQIRTLPLRAHPEDIPSLVWHFLHEISRKKCETFEITGNAVMALRQFPWPGNVRQLKHTISLLCEQAQNGLIEEAHVVSLLGISSKITIEPYQKAKKKTLRQFDIDYFSQVLSYSKGSLRIALELTGMHKKNFYTKLKQLGLSNKDYHPKTVTGKYEASPKAPKTTPQKYISPFPSEHDMARSKAFA